MYTDQDIANLVARVQQLEHQASTQPTAALPQYGIISKNFLTRAFSAWGLCFVSSLLIGIALSCIGVVIGLIMGATVLDWFNQIIGTVPQL